MAENPLNPNENQNPTVPTNPGEVPSPPASPVNDTPEPAPTPTQPVPSPWETPTSPNPPSPMAEPTPDPTPEPSTPSPVPNPVQVPKPTPPTPESTPTPPMPSPETPSPAGGEPKTPWDAPSDSAAVPTSETPVGGGTAVGPSWLRSDNPNPAAVPSDQAPSLSPAPGMQENPSAGPMPWQAPSQAAGFDAELPEAHKGGGFPVIVFVVIILGIIVAVGAFLFTQGAFGG